MIAELAMTAWATAYASMSAVVVARTMARASSPSPGAQLPAHALIVRPCAGAEPNLATALRSFAKVRCSVSTTVMMTVADPDDPAWPIVRAVAEELGGAVQARIVPTSAPNRKVGQLAGALREAAPSVDAVVVIDSDVDLTGVDLDPLLAALERPGVGASYFPPVERGAARTAGDRVSRAILTASWHAFGVLGALDRRGLVGKTFAVRRDALERVGGFEGLQRYLGEDMELARRLAEAGWSTTMLPCPVVSLATARSTRSVLVRYARWLMVIRAQRPALLPSYPLLLAAAPLLVMGGIALAVTGAPGWGALLVALVVAARAVVTAAALRVSGRAGIGWQRAVVDAVLADLALLAAFGRALGPARVRWRDRTLRIGEGGLLRS